MQLDQEQRKRKGYDDATMDRNQDASLSSDSWYLQGWMEGRAAQCAWAAKDLIQAAKQMGIVADIGEMNKPEGFEDAVMAFFTTLASKNCIQNESHHFSRELAWEETLLAVALEYVASNKPRR